MARWRSIWCSGVDLVARYRQARVNGTIPEVQRATLLRQVSFVATVESAAVASGPRASLPTSSKFADSAMFLESVSCIPCTCEQKVEGDPCFLQELLERLSPQNPGTLLASAERREAHLLQQLTEAAAKIDGLADKVQQSHLEERAAWDLWLSRPIPDALDLR